MSNTKIKLVLGLIVLFYACNTSSNKEKKAENDQLKAPNVIVILLDDAGYVDFGFMGSEDLSTPHIDELASAGIIFTDAHVTSTVCAPSRAGLITGQYPQRFGFESNHTGDQETGDIGLSEEVNTLAEVFKQHNYKTAAIGKWHLGAKEHNHPNQRGFDEFYGFLGGARSYFPMENPSVEHMLQHNGKKVNFEGYLTDRFGEFSVDFVEKNKENPFFMYLSYNAVHTPMEAKREDLEKFKNHPRKELAAMTWSLDQNIGKLRQKLVELEMLENTLIFFLSDNGGAHNNQSSSGPLKGWKGNKFEGGHRVPFVVSWPEKLEKGRTFDGLTSSLDIFKTSLSAANISVENESKLDGVNLLPYLLKKENGSPHENLFWRKLEESAIRKNNFKLIQLEGYGNVMYDLSQDLGETKNISSEKVDVLNQLINDFQEWEDEMMKPLWGEPRDWMDVTYHIHQQLMENQPVYYQSPKEMKQHQQKAQNN